eukprot:1157736-Pelagomonas_calceolata.AAC.8
MGSLCSGSSALHLPRASPRTPPQPKTSASRSPRTTNQSPRTAPHYQRRQRAVVCKHARALVQRITLIKPCACPPQEHASTTNP